MPPIATREELVYLLAMGAELEHSLACVYLFAGFSLKRDLDEGGMTAEQLALAKRWKRTLKNVAVSEMLHLAQVNNLLTAIGGAPHFAHPNLPQPASAYPFGMALTLEPFSPRTARRLVSYELPERLSPERERLFEAIRAEFTGEGDLPIPADPDPGAAEEGIEAYPVDFKTVGDFYHRIEAAFRDLPEDTLFIGAREWQAVGEDIDFGKELVRVTDRRSAIDGIEMIVLQGEGAREDAPESHFNLFDGIRREYEAEVERAKAAGSAFAPVRPVVANPLTRRHADSPAGTAVIVDPTTHRAAEIFDLAYESLLHVLMRFFAAGEETGPELAELGRTALTLMTDVVAPLGEALAKMPFGGEHHAGMTAGPSFAFTSDIELIPHKRAAWMVIRELFARLVAPLDALVAGAGAPRELARARDALASLASGFGQVAEAR